MDGDIMERDEEGEFEECWFEMLGVKSERDG